MSTEEASSPEPSESQASQALLFEIGALVVTPGPLHLVEAFGVNLGHLLTKHQRGDWGGALLPEEVQANNLAVQNGGSIRSAYMVADNECIWIITSANRSRTIIIQAEEYFLLLVSARSKRPLFELGSIVATRAVAAHLDKHGINAQPYLDRHVCGDWGEVPAEDAEENNRSVEKGFRLLSSYTIGGKRTWIITEADRSVTTILFPSEY